MFAGAPHEPAFTTPDARSGELPERATDGGNSPSWQTHGAPSGLPARQTFEKDAQQVEAQAGSGWVRQPGCFKKICIHTVRAACDGTTADVAV